MTSAFNRIVLLLRTIVWLRPVQVYWRLWLKIYRPPPRTFSEVQLNRSIGVWTPIRKSPTMTGASEFRFLNQTGAIRTATDWNAPDRAKLWLYNAHYFDDLTAEHSETRNQWHRALITWWIAENPAGTGNGWEPYPTSLRIVNWCKWLLAGNRPEPGMLASLATQADWLARRLEYHLLGNHLFANAKALMFAGAILDHDEAATWQATGLRLLRREVTEQILADGGHFERSVMYHSILTEDLLDLIQLSRLVPDRIPTPFTTNWHEVADRMMAFLRAMTHPDGCIAFFNDGAYGIAPTPDALCAYAETLDITTSVDLGEIHVMPTTGYARVSKSTAVILADVAPVGPDYLPGHAHADTLSFELSIRGNRVLVNGGTSVYGGNPARRMLERSTCFHNTLEIDGQNSSEMWAEFRVARRAQVFDVSHGTDGDTHWLEASHDGYRRINGPIHTRNWALAPNSLTIRDTLDRPANSAIARFRLGPGFSATPDAITGPQKMSIATTGGVLTIEEGTWSPEFGRVVPCEVLTLTMTGQTANLALTWET